MESRLLMRWMGLAVGAAVAVACLIVVPSSEATSLQFVNCVEPDVCGALHTCLILVVGGWPPEPNLNPDCLGTDAGPSPPPEEPSPPTPSSDSNSTEDGP